MSQLEAKHLNISINDYPLIENFHASFQPGQIWGIFGPNGAGKTTLLHTLCGLFPAYDGDILLNGLDLKQIKPKQRAKKIGLLLQDTEFPFPSTVLETALIGRYPYRHFWANEDNDDLAMAKQSLALVALDHLLDRSIYQLSGGEKRRLALATLFTQNPDIYLLDEPTNHLDIQQQFQILSLLKKQAYEKNKTVIMILHDIQLLKTFCDYIIIMQQNHIPLVGKCGHILNKQTLTQMFSVDLLETYALIIE